MPEAPTWVLISTPIISAVATGVVTWASTKLEVFSLRRVRQFEGIWYAYYRDPNTKSLQEEIWTFSPLGKVEVSRGGRTTFKGRLSLKGNKAYMYVDSVISSVDRLFVMLDSPNKPKGDPTPAVCIWLGLDDKWATTAGHGLLSREKLENPLIKDQFLRAGFG
jgi:hypothetical protein